MRTDETADRVLLARASGGDAAAFAQLYDRHIRPVYWQAYSVVRDADVAQECAQDTFLTLWRRTSDVRVVDESLLPWLMTTARYTALNAGRRLKSIRDRSADLDGDALEGGIMVSIASTEDEVLAREIRSVIDDAVGGLSPTDQRLYHLCVEGEHTYDSAARELGVTHAAVRNRVSRLRTRLRTDLSTLREQ